MGYSVASDDRVANVIDDVLSDTPQVGSQAELARLVRERLVDDDPRLRVSDHRVRRIALRRELARIAVRTRQTDQPIPDACPVCDAGLRRVRNRTLDGGEAVVGAACTECPYRTGPGRETPTRYEFERVAASPPDGGGLLGGVFC